MKFFICMLTSYSSGHHGRYFLYCAMRLVDRHIAFSKSTCIGIRNGYTTKGLTAENERLLPLCPGRAPQQRGHVRLAMRPAIDSNRHAIQEILSRKTTFSAS
jgi:hypothetical protein